MSEAIIERTALETVPSAEQRESAAATAAAQSAIVVRPMTGVLGARIEGVDLASAMDDATWSAIHDAFLKYGVIYLPGQQKISHDDHLAFAARFGPIMTVPQLHTVDGYPDIQIIRREAVDTGRVVGENWHTDSTWMETPPSAVVMRAMDVPECGGDTGFADSVTAFDALSPGMQQMLCGLRAVHSATRVFGSTYAQGTGKRFDASATRNVDPSLGDKENTHPVVCTQPGTGRRYLFINRVYVQRFENWTEEESKPLLTFLYEHLGRFEFTCRKHWSVGDMLVWDNRRTMHKAISDYPGKFRYLTRVTIAGDRPA